MGDIIMRFQGVNASIAEIRAIRARVEAATRMATAAAGREMQSQARAQFQGLHPPGFPHVGGSQPNIASGQLSESIQPSSTLPIGRARWLVSVGPNTIYAKAIEFGGTWGPKTAQYLSWFSPWLNRRIFRRSVTLVGWPYMRPAHRRMLVRMHDIFYRYWSGATRG